MELYKGLFLAEMLLVWGFILGTGGAGIKLLLDGRKASNTILLYIGGGLLAISLLSLAYLYFTGFFALQVS